MIAAANKYGSVRAQAAPQATRRSRSTSTPQLWLPTAKGAKNRLRDWYWREIKDGAFLDTYVRREKARTPDMIRSVARIMSGFQQNNKSDFRRLATVPLRLYLRWKAEDPDFWSDDNNIRSLKKDQPDIPAWVGAKRVKGTRTTYA